MATPPLPLSVRALVQLYGVQARTQLGQNFLFDRNVTGARAHSRVHAGPRGERRPRGQPQARTGADAR